MLIDFSNCKIVKRAVEGAAYKTFVEYDGFIWMLKYEEKPTNQHLLNETSYINSCVSEYIGSHIFNICGMKAQETLLGSYKGKKVVACKMFTGPYLNLGNFELSRDEQGKPTAHRYGTDLQKVIDVMKTQTFVSYETIRDYFWDMFVIDALIGNRDRHNGNWGYLIDEQKNEAYMSIVYDCGSCVGSIIPHSRMIECEKHKGLYNHYVIQEPLSVHSINKKKINFHDYINSLENADLNNAILRIVPRVDIDKIIKMIEESPCEEVEKEFHKQVIKLRYEMILLSAYNKLIGKKPKLSNSKIDKLNKMIKKYYADITQNTMTCKSCNNRFDMKDKIFVKKEDGIFDVVCPLCNNSIMPDTLKERVESIINS